MKGFVSDTKPRVRAIYYTQERKTIGHSVFDLYRSGGIRLITAELKMNSNLAFALHMPCLTRQNTSRPMNRAALGPMSRVEATCIYLTPAVKMAMRIDIKYGEIGYTEGGSNYDG